MKDTATNYEEETRVLEAIEAMKSEAGPAFSFAAINLAELERRTGVSRSKLRRLKRNGFEFKPHGNKGRTAQRTGLTGYTEALDAMLRSGIANSSICLERLREAGERFDLVFLDPPYAMADLTAVTEGLLPLLAPGALVVTEHRAGFPYAVSAALRETDTRRWGYAGVTMYREREAEP